MEFSSNILTSSWYNSSRPTRCLTFIQSYWTPLARGRNIWQIHVWFYLHHGKNVQIGPCWICIVHIRKLQGIKACIFHYHHTQLAYLPQYWKWLSWPRCIVKVEKQPILPIGPTRPMTLICSLSQVILSHIFLSSLDFPYTQTWFWVISYHCKDT